MRRLLVTGLLLAVLLVLSAGPGAAGPQPTRVKVTTHPILTLALDWPRVAYASGKEGNSETIHVWNVATGATSAVRAGNHGFAVHHAAQIAITGRRLAWIRAQQLGNTELDHWLYTASLGGRPRLLEKALGYADTGCGLGGPQMAGLVGSGGAFAISTWEAGSSPTGAQLSLVTPTRLRAIATGSTAILSESADAGHIAVLPPATATQTGDYCEVTQPTSVSVYSTTGALLQTIALPALPASGLGYQVAISGSRLVLLTYGLYEPSGPSWVTLTVYDWTSGAVQHTWPVAIPQYPGEVNFSVYRSIAAVEGPFRLHLVDLDTGKDVKIARASGTGAPTALGPHGLVYAVDAHGTGRLVFVPTARLNQLLGR